MYKINRDIYKFIAETLIERFGDGDYYSGVVDMTEEDFRCNFRCSLILHRKLESLPEGEIMVLSDIIPVWWEVHLFTEEGEVVCDLDFEELKNLMVV